ncbi:MAG: hypothetical protein KJO82_02180 [Gammaproteobacteria bacterium]|nr:hypothetical protein [Gammaproteobacteria bacterium]
MIGRLKSWLSERFGSAKTGTGAGPPKISPRQDPPRVRPRPAAKTAKPQRFSGESGGHIEDGGPGKNVYIRNRYVREDTGTHETLKILDDSMLESDDEGGADPYNTGQFDRSKSWNLRTRK